MNDQIHIVHLYPDLLNLYGDRGNIIALAQRLAWRKVPYDISCVSVDESFDPKTCDILFIGGGQDFDQEVLQTDLLQKKRRSIRSYIENNGVVLAICGGFQILGRFYKTAIGETIEMLDILDFYTVGSEKRHTGNLVFEWEIDNSETKTLIVGFENHAGVTHLGENIRPFGKVRYGFGNNGMDQTEGARYKNVFCTYAHGPLLPKNPVLTDTLLSLAVSQKNPLRVPLQPLDDTIEKAANQAIIKRLMKK